MREAFLYPDSQSDRVTETMERYDPQAIEAKWQQVWADEKSFHVPNPDPAELAGGERRKSYVVEMLPYPSGDLHMGHTLNYTIGDVITHTRRRKGMQVLRPMGYDAFGLPAENAAIKEGGHPRTVTERNIVSIREQMHRMGWAIDWGREISTADPAYYRWTQWLFLRFYEKGLAYRKEAPVKWCPNDQTVLANEQVDRRPLRAVRRRGRGEDPDAVVLPDHRLRRRAAGRDGRPRGLARPRPDDAAQLDRPLARRPRRLQRRGERGGAAGLHDAARHAVRGDVLRAGAREPDGRGAGRGLGARGRGARVRPPYRRPLRGRARDEGEGRRLHRALRGQSGQRRADPDLGRRLRADGLRHRRDHGRARARRARLRVRGALRDRDPSGRRARGRGAARGAARTPLTPRTRCSSTPAPFTGLPSPEAKEKIVAWLAEQGLGEQTIGYRLRDWLFSRQRYWGCPIPIIHCPACGEVAGSGRPAAGRPARHHRGRARRAARRSPRPRTGST